MVHSSQLRICPGGPITLMNSHPSHSFNGKFPWPPPGLAELSGSAVHISKNHSLMELLDVRVYSTRKDSIYNKDGVK